MGFNCSHHCGYVLACRQSSSVVVCYIGVGAMLELRNVHKHYLSIPVVCDVSFSACAGEVTGYLGANGSGNRPL
jgi:ABC-type uncharacterized transport system ATPase subunit